MELEWWQRGALRGELERTIDHLNLVYPSRRLDEVSRCRSLFDALNSLWSAFSRAKGEYGESDNKAIKSLLTDGIPDPRREALCNADPVFRLATFEPQIFNHDVLRRSPLYVPGGSVPAELAREAASAHGQLARAIYRWKSTPSEEMEIAVLKKLAQTLYIVRSNLQHGEKSISSSDPRRAKRDQEVCAATRPVLEVLFEALLDYPANHLAIYGSLAPGQPNHAALCGIPGQWADTFVYGDLQKKPGLKAFKWNPAGERIPMKLLSSASLQGHWDRLDHFEGPRYRRILVLAEGAKGEVTVVNLYETMGR